MKAIVSITLIVLLYGINSVPISAIKICASRGKDNENFTLKQNITSVPEDLLNDSNIIHTAVSSTCTWHRGWNEFSTENS